MHNDLATYLISVSTKLQVLVLSLVLATVNNHDDDFFFTLKLVLLLLASGGLLLQVESE